jgi:diaminohydroxyphosphoribosylaminopyrimidine deaminase / 5-amino-6-(5-phosphoribosylamino)uracil reductase
MTPDPHALNTIDSHAAMQLALDLAQQAIGLTEPNPRVGCVITTAEGRVIGQGHTQQAGGAHAEVMALRDAQARGESVAGAVVHVTLEPCAHHGRTPPCCDALIAAKVGEVIYALQDPNPLTAGQGARRLQDAGINVSLLDAGDLATQAHELNIGFFSRMQRGRPWVRMKVAISLDGRTALNNGVSQWITGEAARADGHAWRKRAGACLTGVGTVLEDNPRLDVRWVTTAHQPLRVVVDSRLETPLTSRILDAPGAALIYAAQDHAERRAALQARGAEIAMATSSTGKVDLQAMLADLAQRGINELHVEAGHKLNGSLVREALVDEFLIYMAPILMGSGRELAALGPLESLNDALRLRWHGVTPVGDDLRLMLRPKFMPSNV